MSAAAVVVDVVVPARNAADTLGDVLARLPLGLARATIVVDCASIDATGQVARDRGALVVREPSGGYGAACLRAQAQLSAMPQPPEVVVFLSAHSGNHAAQVERLLEPVLHQGAELAIASGGDRPRLQERAVARLIDTVFHHRFARLGVSRAIRFPALIALGMTDRGDGWDVEMLVRALRLGLTTAEVSLDEAARSPTPAARTLFHILRHATVR
jgi:glycosyltransferase involved in cell wall biosynthesis